MIAALRVLFGVAGLAQSGRGQAPTCYVNAMRGLLVLLAACGGAQTSTKPIENTTTNQPAQKQCTVIPAGKYFFDAAETEELLMNSESHEASSCTTGFAGAAQTLSCQQAKPPVTLEGAFEDKEGVWFTSTTFKGQLEYSDAVVLLGGLKAPDGKTLFIRLELADCTTVDACMAAMEKARQCK